MSFILKSASLFIYLSIYIYSYSPAFMDSSSTTYISSKLLTEQKFISLNNWNILYGDNKKWKFEFENNVPINNFPGRFTNENIDTNSWKGIAWFQTKVYIDSSLNNTEMGILFLQTGASEIYVNGQLSFSLGTIFPSTTDEYSYFDRRPRTIKLLSGVDNIISIRYSDHKLTELIQRGYFAGFDLQLGKIESLNKITSEISNTLLIKQLLFVTIAGTLSLIHLFLFIFDRRQKQNLIYSIFLWFFILFIYSGYQTWFVHDYHDILVLLKIGFSALILTVFSATATIKIITSQPSTFLYIMFGVGIILIGSSFVIQVNHANTALYVYIGIVSTMGGRSLFSQTKIKGISILRTGFSLMSILGIYQVLLNFNLLPALFNEHEVYTYGVICFILSMSVYLAYEHVRKEKELETSIGEVKILSEEKLMKELEAREKDIQNKILEADNRRKTQELDDARSLQLSMLPKRTPATNYFDLAVKMTTAVEVGGDYYDFIQDSPGTLSIALGDATGHGNKAGIMVAINKSMFTSFGSNLLIPDYFKKCTKTLRKMKLGNLFMSLTLIRVNGYHAIASAAGMPPFLLYKIKKKQVREIVIKSMPLGSPADFEYDSVEFEFEPGDVLLLFSDGIVELFNTNKEMFGMERLIATFKECAEESPKAIIDRLFEAGDRWRNTAPQNDDITMLALKAK